MICRVWLWNLAKFTLRNRALRVEVNMSSIKSEPSVVTGDERCCSNGFVTGCKQGLGIPSARASVQSDKRNVGALVGTDHFKAEKTKRNAVTVKRRVQFRLLAIFASLCLSCGEHTVAHAATYEINGNVTWICYFDPNTTLEKRRHFVTLVSETNWWIKTLVIDPPKVLEADSPELAKLGAKIQPGQKAYMGPDGNLASSEWGYVTDTLYIKEEDRYHQDDPAMNHPRSSRHVGFVRERIEITTTRLPTLDNDLCFPIWLAFCSRGSFPNGESYVPSLLWLGKPSSDGGSTHSVFKVTTKRRQINRNSFIEEALFQNQGYAPSYHHNLQYTIKDAPGNKGCQEARYFVTTWTNVGNIEYPAKCCLELRAPKTQQIVQQMTVTITSFIDSTASVPQISPTDRASVTDYRAQSRSGPLRYTSTNGYLTPTSWVASRIMSDSDRLLLAESTLSIRTSRFHPIRVVLLFMVALGPILMVLLLRKIQNRTR